MAMCYGNCGPLRFHAECARCRALVDIMCGCLFEGILSNRQFKYVLAWAKLHKDELMQDWGLAADGRPLNSIAPLM
ncbi:DUF4160 domain-containing protein [Adlercreutzia aquisgranensis]|uniref:DUF4160 domain-containing protein n=1 Tax=Adlercreutzia aquisgranensis TaxID=2941323 RepID=UPI0032E39E82